jgi:hypothetical protein
LLVGVIVLGFLSTIDYPGRGYRGFFGWVQRVRSTDNTFGRRAFEMDPARFFEDSPAPYCWYGFKPVLFDAPSRDRSLPLDWLAHSFGLHASWRRRPEANRSSAGLLLGLRDSDHGQVTLAPLSRLTVHDWKNHRVPLRECYPGWEFASLAEFASGS